MKVETNFNQTLYKYKRTYYINKSNMVIESQEEIKVEGKQTRNPRKGKKASLQ